MLKTFKFNFRYIAAILCLLMCFSIIMVLAFVPIPPKNETLFNVLAMLFFTATVVRTWRVLFPDKEEVKNEKALAEKNTA